MLPGAGNFVQDLIKSAAENPGLKKELIKNPKKVIEDRLKYKFPENFEIAVHEDTPTKLNIVLPLRPEELSEAELAAVSGGAICWGACSEAI